MGKYEPLGQYLRKQRTQEVPLTFREIEKITGVKLPPKAQHHRAWWSNNPDNNVMTKVWLAAGFESAQVDMEGRKLVFRRVATTAEPVSGFAFYERSMALYRDWELADVLEAAEPGERDEVARLIDEQR